MLNNLLSHRVLVVLGKGGVGKTTLSAALAKLAAASGARALVMETDARAPLAGTYNLDASFEPVEIAHHVSLMVLDGRDALEQYLRLVVPGRILLKAVFASRLYQFFVQAAPGLRELMMLGKVYYEAEKKPGKPPSRGLIILDAPASGQALSLLKMPAAAQSTFGDSIVGREASNIARMIRDASRCAIVQVTTADSLSVSETIETHAELSRMHLAPIAILFNRAVPLDFDAGDVASVTGGNAPRVRRRRLEHLAELAKSELHRASEYSRAVARVRDAVRLPVIEVPEHLRLGGVELIDRIAADLAALRDREGERAAHESRRIPRAT